MRRRLKEAPPSQFALRGMLLAAAWVAFVCWLFRVFPPCGLVITALTVHLVFVRLDAVAVWRSQQLHSQSADGGPDIVRPHLQFSLRTMLLATAAAGAIMSAAIAITLPVAAECLTFLLLVFGLISMSALAARGRKSDYAVLLALAFCGVVFAGLFILGPAFGQ